MIDHPWAAANDNARGDEERAVAKTAAARLDQVYARRGNLILPLRFAAWVPGAEAERIELTGGTKRG